MSESQFPRSLFPQFTEQQLEEASKNFKSSVNWTSYKKWIEDGEPFVEHDEVINDLKLENGSGSQRRPAGKYIDLLISIHSATSFSCIYLVNKVKYIKFFKGTGRSDVDNSRERRMKLALTIVPGRQLKKPGKKAIETLY
jgi:hypothetical protein